MNFRIKLSDKRSGEITNKLNELEIQYKVLKYLLTPRTETLRIPPLILIRIEMNFYN